MSALKQTFEPAMKSSAAINTLIDRYCVDGSALARVIDEAAYLTRCSDDKTAKWVRPREYAIKYPYMQLNRTDWVSWLIFDIDHDDMGIWMDEGLPEPNLITRNRNKAGGHIYYAIAPVYTGTNARSKPIRYMRAIYAAIAAKLKADPCYNNGSITKTPGHPWWQTTELHSAVFDLYQLAPTNLPLVSPWGKAANEDFPDWGRNCTVFNRLRQYAYSIVNDLREHSSYSDFIAHLSSYGAQENQFGGHDKGNMSERELCAIVKSVARWTWDRYTGKGKNYRVMKLSLELSVHERQSLGAGHTNQVRKDKTEGVIYHTCLTLIKAGTKLTQTAIAQVAKLSRQTVSKFKHAITKALNQQETQIVSEIKPNKEADTRNHADVNYALHQVTAQRGVVFTGLGLGRIDDVTTDDHSQNQFKLDLILATSG